jgi:hypothetical protein
MSIKNRPYVGNWQINKTLVRHTPDAIVYINGHPEFVTCPSCNKKFDFNKYVTSVTCDAGVEPSAGASVRLSVPKSVTEVFSHDGNYVLKPGLEVTIFMRGYFPRICCISGRTSMSRPTGRSSGLDLMVRGWDPT